LFDVILNEPNWIIVSVVGAILGALVSKYGGIVSYPFRRRPAIRGEWYCYHFDFRDGRLELIEEQLVIRKGATSGIKVKLTPVAGDSTLSDQYEYRGDAEFDERHLLINMRGVTHSNKELISVRLQPRIPPNHVTMFGLWLSYDHDHLPAAGMIMLSRDRKEADEAGRAMLRWYAIRKGAMHLLAAPRTERPRPNA
jgi:hypothetical protein